MTIDVKFVKESFERRPRPLTIFLEDNMIPVTSVNVHPPKLTMEVPSLFPYTDSKMVP